jgi:hypothetical protein
VQLGPLDTPIGLFARKDLDDELRSLCGILLETPQFFLAGVAPDGPGAPTLLRVCNGSPCTYQEMCLDLTSHTPIGTSMVWSCAPSSVTLQNVIAVDSGPASERTFCPDCPVISADPSGCFDPAQVRRKGGCNVKPPMCDATCTRIDCCGGPIERFDHRGTILLSGEGAVVKDASGVRVRRAGSAKVEELAAGERLGYGDVFELSPNGSLNLDNAGRAMKYAAHSDKSAAPRYVLVTGPKAMEALGKQKVHAPLSAGQLEWLRTKGWLQSPDGSTPIKLTPAMFDPASPAEKAWQERMKQMKQMKQKP